MRVAALCLAAMATGGPTACDIGPTYHTPTVEAPRAWGPEPRDVPSRTVEGDVDLQWWSSFRDRELSSLVGRSVTQNLDLHCCRTHCPEHGFAAGCGLPGATVNRGAIDLQPHSHSPHEFSAPLHAGFIHVQYRLEIDPPVGLIARWSGRLSSPAWLTD
jgi:hypothetical protein